MRVTMLALILGLAGLLLAETNAVTQAVAPVSAAETESLAALRAENEALRRENQLLRRELVAKKGSAPDALLPVKAVEPKDMFVPPAEDTGYWLSSKSKVRHNKRCRNYRKVRGYPCGPKDGRPCGMCGG